MEAEKQLELKKSVFVFFNTFHDFNNRFNKSAQIPSK